MWKGQRDVGTDGNDRLAHAVPENPVAESAIVVSKALADPANGISDQAGPVDLASHRVDMNSHSMEADQPTVQSAAWGGYTEQSLSNDPHSLPSTDSGPLKAFPDSQGSEDYCPPGFWPGGVSSIDTASKSFRTQLAVPSSPGIPPPASHPPSEYSTKFQKNTSPNNAPLGFTVTGRDMFRNAGGRAPAFDVFAYPKPKSQKNISPISHLLGSDAFEKDVPRGAGEFPFGSRPTSVLELPSQSTNKIQKNTSPTNVALGRDPYEIDMSRSASRSSFPSSSSPLSSLSPSTWRSDEQSSPPSSLGFSSQASHPATPANDMSSTQPSLVPSQNHPNQLHDPRSYQHRGPMSASRYGPLISLFIVVAKSSHRTFSHGATKPVKCKAPGCPAAFNSASELSRHNQTNHGAAPTKGPFFCGEAGCRYNRHGNYQGFRRRDKWSDHMKTAHHRTKDALGDPLDRHGNVIPNRQQRR
jgi:hypothetical protein